MRINTPLSDYFYFKKGERRALLVLTFATFIIAFIPLFYPLFFTNEATDFSDFKKEIAAFNNNEGQITTAKVELRSEQEADLFTFNPNQANKEDFLKLGLSDKTAQSIINYRSKGGHFYKAEDFKKIYTLKEEDYQRLKPFINIQPQKIFAKQESANNYPAVEKREIETFTFNPNNISYEDLLRLGIAERTAKGLINYRKSGAVFRTKSDLKKVYNFKKTDYNRLENYIDLPTELAQKSSTTKKTFPKKEVKKVSININTATPEQWQELRGIGVGYAKRIVNFRDKLGGFISINQVAETYALPDSTFQKIKPFLKLTKEVKKIKINTISLDDLKKHPYIKWKEANRIIAYRKQHGNFENIDDFKKIPAFSDDFFDKVSPYLSFQ